MSLEGSFIARRYAKSTKNPVLSVFEFGDEGSGCRGIVLSGRTKTSQENVLEMECVVAHYVPVVL